MIRRKLKRVLIAAVVLGLVVWAGRVWVWPLMANPFINVATLKQETLTDRTTVEMLVVRSETVVRAPSDGVLRADVDGGERVSTGAGLGVVRGARGEYVIAAPHAGLVFWGVDGLEETLQVGSVLPAEAVPEVRAAAPTAGGPVTKGAPLCRVVDNLSPVSLHFNVSPGVLPQSMLREDESWRIYLDGQEFTGRVTSILPHGESTLVELSFGRYPNRLLRDRRVPCAVITREMKGFIIPREAIVLRSGRCGVYLLCKDRIGWRPVRVEGQLGGDVQITGEALTEGGLYVANPRWADDGRCYLKDR